ncbi:MAG: hypothetical protein RLZZ244_2870 [Verrucomicrobiota bacterium]|jgi:adenylate cyclase
MSAELFHFLISNDDGSQHSLQLPPGDYLVGRDPSSDIVLSSPGVSRKHARLTLSDGALTVEDLGSRAGTWAGDDQISVPTRVALPAAITLGHLLLEIFPTLPGHEPSGIHAAQNLSIALQLSAAEKASIVHDMLPGTSSQRLEMLYELPLQFAAEKNLDRLFHLILRRMLELLPGAVRGAVMISDPASSSLLLRASIPEGPPPISRTLIHRALREQSGFIWGDEESDHQDLSSSMAAIGIRTGMYAPLVWEEKSIGILFVDNPNRRQAFSQEDLRFLLSVAHYAASAVANRLLQEEIVQNNRTLENLLTNFSPKLRQRLLQKSREGRLQPGGEKSTVTILVSDLRGFTRTSQSLSAESIVEMLNDYFQALAPTIFAQDGTIDKFMGDGILAVFGSPEFDPEHARKATQAAVDMQRAVRAANQRRRAAGLPFCELGVGVYTGEVLHGFIGADERLEYTVIGDTVNKASRYCDGARSGEIVLGPLTYESIQPFFSAKLRMIDTKHEGQLPAHLLWFE